MSSGGAGTHFPRKMNGKPQENRCENTVFRKVLKKTEKKMKNVEIRGCNLQGACYNVKRTFFEERSKML